MRIVTSKTACDYVAQGKSAQQAADQVIAYLADRVGGYGGIIMMDYEGQGGDFAQYRGYGLCLCDVRGHLSRVKGYGKLFESRTQRSIL